MTDGGFLIRSDAKVPVLVFETETDIAVLRYDRAEQPDSATVRVWEVAGTAHVDAFALGSSAGQYGCTAPVNSGPQHYVVKAAINALERWVRTGKPPVSAPRLAHVGATLTRDARGVAVGGIRTPPVDVPVGVESGEPAPGGAVICQLFGITKTFDSGMLAELYGSKSGYLRSYERAANHAVAAGYVLAADQASLVADARRIAF